jgi:hypothetical protein
LFRIWLVFSVFWIAGVALFGADTVNLIRTQLRFRCNVITFINAARFVPPYGGNMLHAAS